VCVAWWSCVDVGPHVPIHGEWIPQEPEILDSEPISGDWETIRLGLRLVARDLKERFVSVGEVVCEVMVRRLMFRRCL